MSPSTMRTEDETAGGDPEDVPLAKLSDDAREAALVDRLLANRDLIVHNVPPAGEV